MSRPGPGLGWMAARVWEPFAFQREVWRAIAEGRGGLLHATTGAGKTYAVWPGGCRRSNSSITPSHTA